jgi:predicted transposase/invertase (TIGR01784 family)
MLGNLDNEVIFKKAFTDKTVFKAFVRDILGIEVEIDKIETEKKFEPKIGYVDFELDIFAESIDKRVCIEIQRIEYDVHFDRFLHYFLMLIAEQQKGSKYYGIERTVYVIVVLTAPYKISEKNGKPILDEVLLLKLNPQTLQGEVRDLYGHQFVCLNPNHPNDETPKQIRDWLDLIYESIHHPENPNLNTKNEGIKKAAELISFENLTPTERMHAKNKEGAKIVIATTKEEGKQEEKIEIAKKMLKRGASIDIIAEDTGLSIEQIEELRNEINP